MAVFTIDSLILHTPREGDPPATIVLIIDETQGADAMVAYQTGLRDLDALNSPDARIVLVPDSPSEMLTRVLRSQFNLGRLPIARKDSLIAKEGPEDVLKAFRETGKANSRAKQAFVLWEPYVSQALKEPGAIKLVDSDRFKGYIVDVLTVRTDYLRDHRNEVEAVVRAYLEVLHEQMKQSDGMVKMVEADSHLTDPKNPLDTESATAVVKGVWWKNTVENYAHFGLLPREQSQGLQTVEEMIKNITSVLDKTKQPTDQPPGVAQPDKLIDAASLRVLYEIKPRALYIDDEQIRKPKEAPPISDAEWQQLRKLGSVQAKPITFKAGLAKMVDDFEDLLDELAQTLGRFPTCYLRIEGNSLRSDDPDINKLNKALAGERAEAVRKYLVDTLKIPAHRLKAVANEPGGGKDVIFVFLQAQ
jgi:outer membrane protein OmpA-like peptidoglycan-associated protein